MHPQTQCRSHLCCPLEMAPGGWAPPCPRQWTAGPGRLRSESPLFPTAMLLLSGALVSGPYALITTAVSADLVSHTPPPPLLRANTASVGKASFTLVSR